MKESTPVSGHEDWRARNLSAPWHLRTPMQLHDDGLPRLPIRTQSGSALKDAAR